MIRDTASPLCTVAALRHWRHGPWGKQVVCYNVTMSLIIRQATPADAAAIARLNEDFNGIHTASDAMASRLERCIVTERVLLAEIDGLAIGFLSLWVFPIVCATQPYAEISELFVEEGYRRRGVGRALVEEAVEIARLEGATEVKLNTAFRNTAAQQLYYASGFHNLALHLCRPVINQE